MKFVGDNTNKGGNQNQLLVQVYCWNFVRLATCAMNASMEAINFHPGLKPAGVEMERFFIEKLPAPSSPAVGSYYHYPYIIRLLAQVCSWDLVQSANCAMKTIHILYDKLPTLFQSLAPSS